MTEITADELPIRGELIGVSAYGAPQLDVAVRLNTNENPHPPTAETIAAIRERIGEQVAGLQRYPDRDAVTLRGKLAEYLNESTGAELSVDNLWAANGSNEILQQLLQLFGGAGRTALGFEPTYSMHALISRGTQTRYLTVGRDSDFAITPDAAAAAIKELQPDVVFVCSPNNPTGTATALDTIARLYDQLAEHRNGVLIVDEAYAEFSNSPSAITLLPGRERLIVTRTMSKAFAFAGARVGYLAAHPAVVEGITRVRLPYHLSGLTQAAAIAAVEHAKELQSAVDDLRVQRDRILAACRELGLQVVPSDANFVLFGGFADQSVTWQALLDRGVLVRDVGLSGWLRVTAGTEAETDAFLTALQTVVAQATDDTVTGGTATNETTAGDTAAGTTEE